MKGETMKIFTLRADDIVIKKIDELASSVSMSRNEYINRLLENHVLKKEVQETEQTYQSLVKNIGKILQSNTREISELKKSVEDLELSFRERGIEDEQVN